MLISELLKKQKIDLEKALLGHSYWESKNQSVHV